MKLRTSAMTTGAVVAALLTATLTNPTAALAEPGATEECADYTFVAARGSGEPDDDDENGMGLPLAATYDKLKEYFQPFGLSLDYYRIKGYRAVDVGDVSHRATADHGTWNAPKVTYAYQWSRNGATIAGATKATYTTTSADVGQRLMVTVTVRKTGYTSGSATALIGRIYQ